MPGTEIKIFDPAQGFAPLTKTDGITDATVTKRSNRWWMAAAGQILGEHGIHLFSASLPEGAPLAATGWTITADPSDSAKPALLAAYDASHSWDFKGGRHCPSYVKGFDPHRRDWVERIYYAGSAENYWGPYNIGYLEWDGVRWVDQPAPVFAANEEWEHGSVYEPNLIFHDGKWKMWYVAGSNQENYIVHGYAESEDGRTGWSKHNVFFPPQEKVFDFCVIPGRNGFEAVFSRVWLGKGEPPPETGLWWSEAQTPSSDLSDWSAPVQIMTAEDRGWHAGPWKPSAHYSEIDRDKLLIFFDGVYGMYNFTLGCLEIARPA